MKKVWIAVFGGAVLSAVPALADMATFQFNEACTGITNCQQQNTNANTYGNSYVFYSSFTTNGNINATVYAFSNDTTTSTSGTTFQTAEVGHYAGTASITGALSTNHALPLGLGECNKNEGVDCSSPQHQVDNSSGYDFILVEFSAAVDLNSVVLSTYQGSSNTVNSQNFSYIAGNTTLGTSPVTAGTSLSSVLGTNGANMTDVNCTNMSNNDCSTGASNTYSLAGNDVTWMLIAAQYTNTGGNDYFKISDLTVDNYSSPKTPEPATFALFGLALTGLGVYGRKRNSARS